MLSKHNIIRRVISFLFLFRDIFGKHLSWSKMFVIFKGYILVSTMRYFVLLLVSTFLVHIRKVRGKIWRLARVSIVTPTSIE